MSLSWGGIKRLVRLQAVADEFVARAGARADGRTPEFEMVSLARIVDALVEEVRQALSDSDSDLAEEFERLVNMRSSSPALRARILASWLKGLIEGETLEVRLRMGDDRRRGKLVPAGNGG
jgi:hypothetical protein